MRIEELIKEVSQGEFKFTQWHENAWLLTSVKGGDGNTVCDCMRQSNARLIAHCLNNFMPMMEALEGLLRSSEPYKQRKKMTPREDCNNLNRDWLLAKQALESAKEVQDGH